MGEDFAKFNCMLVKKMIEKNNKLWDNIHNELKKEFGIVAYKSWLIRLKILGFKSNGELKCLSLPTEFLKDWVVGH